MSAHIRISGTPGKPKEFEISSIHTPHFRSTHRLCLKPSFAIADSLHFLPFTNKSHIRRSETINSPAHSVYKPPSPIAFWSGAATSAAMNPKTPRKRLFVATAVEDRPVLASTMYASVLA